MECHNTMSHYYWQIMFIFTFLIHFTFYKRFERFGKVCHKIKRTIVLYCSYFINQSFKLHFYSCPLSFHKRSVLPLCNEVQKKAYFWPRYIFCSLITWHVITYNIFSIATIQIPLAKIKLLNYTSKSERHFQSCYCLMVECRYR